MKIKTLWKFLIWIPIVGGLITHAIGLFMVSTQSTWGDIPNEFWFYDAIASGIFGVFFLVLYFVLFEGGRG